MKNTLQFLLMLIASLNFSTAARALPIDNGNTLALDYVSAKTLQQKKDIVVPAVGKLHYFRYLKITEMTEVKTNGSLNIYMKTVEPGSDMIVEFKVLKNVSLKILDTEPKTVIGSAVGVQGRIESIGKVSTNTIVLNPVIVKHKDKLAPIRGKELLTDLDPNARYGTDTSGDKPVIIKKPK